MTMTHAAIIHSIELFAPLKYQESYDNSGWQVGDPSANCTGVIINLDVTESVLEEAVKTGSNLIIVHHPLIFGGIKSLTGQNYVERILIKAIQNGISIYACHTNLDNVQQGVNAKIAEKLGLKDVSILQPMSGVLSKLIVYVPHSNAAVLKDVLFAAGAGHIGEYSECSFSTEGSGTFKPGRDSTPVIGKAGGSRESVNEERIEVILPAHVQGKVLTAMKAAHPYEEVAYDLVSLQNVNQHLGAGISGYLPKALSKQEFLTLVKKKMKASVIRYTQLDKKKIAKIAVCGGSGGFLLKSALSQQCDAFVTADFKYHQFFDGENKIMITDIGHYETEQFTSEIIYDIIIDKFPNFAVRISKIKTNPVKYYF